MIRELKVQGPLGGGEINALVDKSEIRECRSYADLFFDHATQERSMGRSEEGAQLEMMGHVTSIRLVAENPHNPLQALFSFEDSRSATPEDFDDQQLALLDAVVDELSDDELRARVFDLLWLRRRDAQSARHAVRAYLQSAERLLIDRWHSAAERLERALRLAALVDRGGDLFSSTVERIQGLLQQDAVRALPHLCGEILRVLAEHRSGEATDCAELCAQLASRVEDENRFDQAITLWELAVDWHGVAKDDEGRITALRRVAEVLLKQAASRSSVALVEAHFLRRALEAFRRVPGARNEREEVYARLRQAQRRAVGEMRPIKVATDGSEMVREARKAVEGRSLRDAVLALVSFLRPLDYAQLREEAKERRQQFSLQRLFAASFMDSEGKVVAEAPAGWPGGDGDEGKVLWIEVVQSAGLGHNVSVQGFIEPARRQILLEHWISENQLWPILSHSSFIPEDRRLTFLLGLTAGFRGDFVTAMQLLVPQVENSLRELLQRAGHETSAARSTGIQEDLQLGTLIDRASESRILPEDLCMELRVLLLERTYANLRNRIAHGLVSDVELMNSPASVYVWWLILYLCLGFQEPDTD